MKMNTCNLAEHSDKGMTSMVSKRMGLERIMRVPMSAGTLQPKPISIMTKPRPSRPILAIRASIKNAARDK